MSLLSSPPRLQATLDTKLLALSPAIPLAIVGHCFGFGEIWVFTLGLLGLALLAERVNFLMEQVVYRLGPTGKKSIFELHFQVLCFLWR
ncbi:hypothetical protein L6164_002305 [Bauhinia variegata]|uniref:Uncharacterized protein n=1 Tax=Bauhinia variegata TaxID=167791 RepID=A0ACB9PXL2_BAUVA|nr:hypothetical protein L6164_002305 [Bauhinia variegata]